MWGVLWGTRFAGFLCVSCRKLNLDFIGDRACGARVWVCGSQEELGAKLNDFQGRTVKLNSDRTVKLGRREEGVWNVPMRANGDFEFEMEFDLDPNGENYILYQGSFPKPKFFNGVTRLNGGKIYLVKGLPNKGNLRQIGTFRVSPVPPKRNVVSV